MKQALRMATPRSIWAIMPTVVLVVALSAVVAMRAGAAADERSERFWSTVQYAFMEAEWYGDLADMTMSADAVVIGSIVAISPGRVFGDPPDNGAYYAEATLRVEQLIRGRLVTDGDVRLEIFMAEPEVIHTLEENLPGDTGVYFLRHKGAEAVALDHPAEVVSAEQPFYRLVSMQGLLRRTSGGTTATMPGQFESFLVEMNGTSFSHTLEDVWSSSR